MEIDQIRNIIKQKTSLEVRNLGNPNETDIDRELARAGYKRKPDDIPTQDVQTRIGTVKPGNVVKGAFISSTDETGGMYKFGSPVRPPIKHDTGFSNFPKRDAELEDYWELLKWYSMLEGAEALRPDLTDGVGAYRHFLEGEGKPRIFSYERYINNDESGKITLRSAILDAQDAAIQLWTTDPSRKNFFFTGPPIPCGAVSDKLPNVTVNFPYPITENWQKAIGAHVIWLSGYVEVKINPIISTLPEFSMNMTLHAEDQYNFNPGARDIATGAPDSANGNFVVVGFAHGYYQSSELYRSFKWKGIDLGVASMGVNKTSRQRQPDNNRRIRNKI